MTAVTTAGCQVRAWSAANLDITIECDLPSERRVVDADHRAYRFCDSHAFDLEFDLAEARKNPRQYRRLF